MNDKNKDLAIIGCGPAGLSAAINAKIRNLDFVLHGTDRCSTRLRKAPEVNNYPGFYEISGEQLINKFMEHLKNMEITINRNRVDNIFKQQNGYTLFTRERQVTVNSIIIAVGISNEKTLPGEEEMIGKGVSYCATCDGPLYKNKNVAIIASTKEGIEEVNYLSDIAKKVYLITDSDLTGAVTKKISKKAEIIKKKPKAIRGKDKVEKLEFEDGKDINLDGIFIYRKVTPPDKLLNGLKTDDEHIIVNKNMETNLEGVFAAGDCTGHPYQISKAVGEGQMAALQAASYLQELQK